MFKHFDKLSLTLGDLKKKYAGQTGVWLAYTFPSMDERSHMSELGYYEGPFEAVLKAVLHDHGRAFVDGAMGCGEIVPIVPKKCGS